MSSSSVNIGKSLRRCAPLDQLALLFQILNLPHLSFVFYIFDNKGRTNSKMD